MRIVIAGDLTENPNVVELHFRLLAARREVLWQSPDVCTVDL